MRWKKDVFVAFVYTYALISFIDAALSAMNYDANKLPLGMCMNDASWSSELNYLILGKLSKATILKGFAALKVILKYLFKPSDLQSSPYPHGSLFRK